MKNNNTRFKIGILLVVGILAGVIVISAYMKKDARSIESGATAQIERTQGLHLVVAPAEYDFGVVKQSGGIISTVFELYNDGSKDVVITGTPASCSCTVASVDKSTLAPGERGMLTVRFDPNYHDEGEGRFFRSAMIKSNVSGDAPEAKIWVQVDYDLGKDKLKFPGAEVAE